MPEQTAADNLKHHLAENSYPGRGLIIGRDTSGGWVQAYWIMGRSDNSRNRIFAHDGGTVRTAAADPSKVEDPSLIIYNALRQTGSRYIVTNGAQTDGIYDGFGGGHSFADSLLEWAHEPDAPNNTPRISGCLDLSGDAPEVWLSIIVASAFGDDASEHRFFRYAAIEPGYGYGITTYQGDGSPLPPFEGSPLVFPLTGDSEAIADTLWSALDTDNRISLAVASIGAGGDPAIVLRNKHKGD